MGRNIFGDTPGPESVFRDTPGPARRFFATVAIAVSAAVASTALADSIAVVDMQGAVMQTEDGIRAQATLKKLFDRHQQELDAKQTQLTKMRSDIEKQARILSREALARRMDAWQRDMVALQTVFVDYEKELQKKQTELTAPIIQRIVVIVGRIAKEKGFDVVIDKQAAPYARPDLDLTDRVIQEYNSGGGEEKKN
jgi:outer membrane protein